MSEETKPPRFQWKVTGARINNGEDVTLYVASRSADAAERFVAKQGIAVSSVEPVPPAAPRPVEPEPEGPGAEVPMVYVDGVRPGAAFVFGFFAFLGAVAAWVILAAAFAVVMLALGKWTL